MTKCFLSLIAVFFLCSCASYATPPDQAVKPSDPSVFDYSYKACDILLHRAMAPIDRQRDILVASFVNSDNLEESSTLGRTISDNFVTYLVTQGYKLSEIKLRNNLLVKQDAGEFMLSRNLKNILISHNVQVVLVGTYSVGESNVYVTAKLINPVDSVIIASVDYKMPMTRDIKKMLGAQ